MVGHYTPPFYTPLFCNSYSFTEIFSQVPVLGAIRTNLKTISNTQAENIDGQWCIPTGLLTNMGGSNKQCVLFYCTNRTGWVYDFKSHNNYWYIIVRDATSAPGEFAGSLYYI